MSLFEAGLLTEVPMMEIQVFCNIMQCRSILTDVSEGFAASMFREVQNRGIYVYTHRPG
jgi:hypothetical protein